MERMDSDGSHLPVLPVHRWRGDDVFPRNAAGTWSVAPAADPKGERPHGDHLRPRPRAQRVSELRPDAPAGPGGPPAYRSVVPPRRRSRPGHRPSRAGRGIAWPPAGVLGPDGAGAGAGGRRGRARAGEEPLELDRPADHRCGPYVAPDQDLGPRRHSEHHGRDRHGALWRPRRPLGPLSADGSREDRRPLPRREPRTRARRDLELCAPDQ